MSDEEVQVRELLGRAVDTVPVPVSRGGESVFARAGRLRRRRRVAATGATAVAAAAAVVLGTGVLPVGHGQTVAASPTAGELGGGAAGFAKLLPKDTGKIREISMLRLIKGVPKAPLPKPVGPYDGEYAVTRDGGTGFIAVRVAKPKDVKVHEDPCALPRETPRKIKCSTEKVPGGLLSVWQWDEDALAGGQPHYGAEFDARLRLTDGTLLTVRDSTGWTGQGSQGPLLDTAPLTRAQLRALALNPQLRP